MTYSIQFAGSTSSQPGQPTALNIKITAGASNLSAVPAGTYTWEVHDDTGGAALATVVLPVLSIAAAPTLGIVYDDPTINSLQSGASIVENNHGVAVVGDKVSNVAVVDIPLSLPTTSTAKVVWTVLGTTWGTNMVFEQCAGGQVAGKTRLVNSAFCSPTSASRLVFRVRDSESAPLDVTLQLAASDRVMLSVPLRIASRAQVESIPLPIASATFVNCAQNFSLTDSFNFSTNEDLAKNGQTLAVTDASLGVGRCVLAIDAEALDSATQRDLNAFGPQVISVTVHKEGASSDTDGTANYRVALSNNVATSPAPDRWVASWLPPGGGVSRFYETTLPPTKGDVSGEGFYDVTVQVLTTSTIPYRVDGDSATKAGLAVKYSSRLRLMGAFAWPKHSHVRTFVTVPVNITGIRFPASPFDLHKTSDQTKYEAVPLQAGILAALELWDYDTASSLLPIPLTALTGFNLLNLENGSFVPSFVAGGSFSLPLVDSPSQLGTSVAIGMFWEHDFREINGGPQNDHFLITLGLNVLTLASPK